MHKGVFSGMALPRWTKVLRFAGLFACSLGLLGVDDPDTAGKASPSAAQVVPVRLGSVDAVRGNLSLAMPLGPKLPGRLPVGLVWRFDSQDPVHFRAGGTFAAVVWPVSGAVSGYGFWSPTLDVRVGATTYSFLYSHSATSGVPVDGEVSSLLTARGVDIGAAEAAPFEQRTFKVSAKRPSSDGTRWYFETCWQVYTKIGSYKGEDVWGYKDVAQRKAIVDGPNAIWIGDGAGNHFTNQWGDHVVAEPYGSGGIRLYNKNSPTEYVQLALNLPTGSKVAVGEKTFQVWQLPANLDDPALRATIDVTNGMGLPSVTIKGIYREKLTQVGDPGGRPGFIPYTWTVFGGAESTTTQFTWSAMGAEEVPTTTQDPEGPGFTKMVPAPIATLTTITHPNGLVERFGYADEVGNLSSKAFGLGGSWVGYHIGVSGRESASSRIPNPSSMPAVASIISENGGPGQSVLIVRQQPLISKAAGTTSYSWTQSDHVTWVLQYPKAAPSTGESFRGYRIVHPSANNAADHMSASAFLFATSAVVATERIHGSGIPGNPSSPWAWTYSSLNKIVDQLTVMDGWDLRSWVNPTGSLTALQPVTAVATRTTVYTPNLPVKITVAGRLRDTWGPTSTDEFTLPPAALPAKDGSNPGVWSSGLGSQSGNLQRTGVISRQWDSTALELVTNSDEKTLSGSDLPALRGVASVSFGQTAFNHEGGTALLKNTTGTRDGAVAQEARTYVAGKPLVESVTKSLTQGADLPYSGSIGTTYTYDTTPYQWLLSETDKLTGRTTNYQRDALGRVTFTTDPNGVQVRTEYDGWGRVSTVTRLAKGSAGSLVTAYAYDPAGLWKTATVTADGRSLTTRTEFDKHGRVVRVVFPDGSTQQTGYDGWGQKTWQTPVLKPGQAGYGDFTWTYSDKGQVMASFDPKGRRLSSAYDPAIGPSSLWEPQEVAGEGIVTKTWDDRGYLRKEVHDRLGQKRKVVDQANQPSTYTYDRDGHLVSTTQGTQTRSYAYDPKTGWLTNRTEPEEGTTTYDDFTALGTPRHSRMTGRNNQSSVETVTTLDAWHRPTQIDVTNAGSLVTRRTLTYRNDFNVPTGLTETQPGGTLTETYGYDDLARLNLKTVSDGTQTFTVSRALDASGNVVSLTYPSGGGRGAQTATTEFDTLNRPWILRMDSAIRGQMTYGAASGTGWTDTLLYGNGATTASAMSQGELVSVIHQVMSGLPGNEQVNHMTWSAGGLLLSRGPSATAGDAANDRFEYDALQRLTYAKTWGINGELAQQWFRYDTWGNRIRSDYTYAANGGMAKPDELMAWSAAYDGGNRLPTQVNGLAPGSTAGGTTAGTVSGSLLTSVLYDDLGRITRVNAIPGNTASQTNWAYDPSGRITSETVNGVTTTFLLDGEGLRFKRMKADGSAQYTVYGFGREPLSTFEKTPAIVTTSAQGPALGRSTARRAAARGPVMQLGGGEPVGAYIDAPAAGTTLYAGQAVSFLGDSDLGTTFSWTFGDGTTASGRTPVKTYATPGTYTVTLRVGGGGAGTIGSTTSRVYTVAVAKPVIGSFTVSPATIPAGGSATLSWSVTGATSLSLDNGIGAVTGTTSRVVSPGVTTTYTLSATNAGGTVTRSVTVTVVQPPAISGFIANPSSIYQGDGSTLSWSVSGATGLSLDNGIGTVTGTTSRAVSPSATTTYTLTATNTVNGVSVSRGASVTVRVNPRPTVPSIDSFTADASSIAAGTGTTLRWSVSNSVGAVTVTLSYVGTVGGSGSQWVAPGSTTTYTLTATNTLDPSKKVSRDVTVTVVNPPVITFGANPGTINVGASSTLSWNVGNGPTSVSISPGIGAVGGSGSVVVSPGATTTYTLTASNLGGTVTAAVTVYVTQKPVIVSFTASPSQINQGGSATLAWTVQGATGLTVNGTAVGGTSLLVSPTVTTTYTLVASNSAGSASASTKVTVVIPERFQWKRSMVYGFGTLISEERPEGTIYVQGDQVGSPNVLTNASRVVVGRSKNLPFGERFGSSGDKSARRYTNHEDQDGSAIYMQARTYLPTYGKFAQVDPAYDQTKDDPESWNLYNYVTNNPVTHTDPDGREASLGTMGVGFTNWFWDAVADYDAMVAKAQSQHADQATKDLPGSNNPTKPQEARAPETKTTTTTSTSPPAADKPATETAQTEFDLSDYSGNLALMPKPLYTNPVTGEQEGVPDQPVLSMRDQKDNPVDATSLNLGGLRPGTENTANIGEFGSRRGARTHTGLDQYAPIGVPIYAAHSGVVTRLVSSPDGNAAGIRISITGRVTNGAALVSSYWHLSSVVNFRQGAHVDQGAIIGYAGISGNAADYRRQPQHHHLHFQVTIGGELRNPLDFLNQR